MTKEFTERDQAIPAEQQGLFRKFDVRRVDGSDAPGGKHHGCRYFVLDMTHDAHAPAALLAYANSCASTHPQLAADLRAEFGTAPSASIADIAGVKPVAWQYKDRYGKWEPVDGLQVEWHRARGFEVRSLYAAPPAPSVADADRRKELTEALGLPTNGIRDGKKAVFGWDYLIALVRNLAESEAPSVADAAGASERMVTLFDVLMLQNIMITDEAYLTLRVVGVPPTETQFAAEVNRVIDAAIAKESGK